MNGRSVVAHVALICGLASALISVTADARAVRGVACNDGFFVNAPDKRIFWIDDARKRKIEVHDGRDQLVVIAECGSGVVSVFNGTDGATRAFYSPDCHNLSKAEGESELVYEGEKPVTGLTVDESGLTLTLKSGATATSAACAQSGNT